MFEDLDVANKEYEDLKAKYDELVIAKNGADEKIKTYEEGNKNYENEIQRLKIKNYELFEQVTNNNQSNQDKHEEDELKLTKKISETENRLNKLKKILYRFKVCERILNNEEV